jgi:hypothetical protein
MRYCSILFACLFTSGAFAQKKELSERQMLRNERTNITESLPQVIGWMNDEQLLISKRSHPDSPARGSKNRKN